MQLIGTLLFNVSTFTALNANLTTHQINHRVWAPDAFGSVAFLVSSALAFAEVCHRWVCFRRPLAVVVDRGAQPARLDRVRRLGGRVAGRALVGRAVSARIANSGTWVGGVCFLIGAVLLMPEAARQRRAAMAEATT